MSFEPSYEKIVSSYRRRIGEMQTIVECKLPIVSDSVASKVLVANVAINNITGTASGNAVMLDGVAKAQVMYVAEDGGYRSMDYTIEFKDKYLTEADVDASEIIARADIVDVNYAIDGNMIRVTGVANITIDGIYNDNVNALISTNSEDVFSKMEEIGYLNFLGIAQEKFDVSSDYVIQDAVLDVLSVCPSVYIDRVEPMDNYAKITGYVNVITTYSTNGDNSTLRTHTTSFDFTQEVALTGITESSRIESVINIQYSNIALNTNIEADTTAITINMPLDYMGYVWNNKIIDVVSDLYSTTNLLTCNTVSFNTFEIDNPIVTSSRLSGMISLMDNEPAIDEILGVTCSNAVVAGTNLSGDTLTVDGVAYINVLYRNTDLGATFANMVQLPFSVDVRGVDANSMADVTAQLQNITAKARRGVEIEIMGDIIVNATMYRDGTQAVIDSVAIGEEKIDNDYCMSIYFAKSGDTVWDIAKKMSVSEDAILAQNQDLTLPIQEGERIVVYRQS